MSEAEMSGGPPPSPLEKCLELISCPSDERKMVGLLLATKVLKRDDESSLRLVREATGRFLDRLLLPLPRDRGYDTQELLAKEALNRSLALAVLAAFSTLPDASDSLARKAQTICEVLQRGSTVLPQPGDAPDAVRIATAAAAAAQDDSATQDAAECLAALCSAGPGETRAAVAAGAVPAAAQHLSREVGWWEDPQRRHLGAQEPAGSLHEVYAGRRGRVERSLQLLTMLLAGTQFGNRGADGKQRPGEDAAGSPELSDRDVRSLAAAMRPLGWCLARGDAAARGDPAWPAEVAVPLQLQAVSATQLTLDALLSGSHSLHPTTQGDTGLLRAGVASMLRGRGTPGVRHAGIRLAAAAAGLFGAGWLAGGGAGGDVGAGVLLGAVAEVLRVEVSLLLNDALDPDQPVPDPFGLPLWQGAGAQGGNQGDRGNDGGGGSNGGGGSQGDGLGPLPAPKAPIAPSDEGVQGKGGFRQGTVRAGDRARVLLPPCLALFEASVEALASDQSNESEEGPGMVADTGAVTALDPAVASTVLRCLGDACGSLLEFLARVRGGGAPGASFGAGADVTGSRVVLGVARAAGRFLADCPQAHRKAFLAAIPAAASLTSAGPGQRAPAVPEGLRFFLPAIAQIAAECDPSGPVGARSLLEAGVAAVLLKAVSHGCGELSSALRRLSKPANSYALEAPLQWRERQKRGDAADGSGDTSDATLPVDEDLVMVLEGAAALGSVCGVCVDVLHGAGSVRAMRSVAAEVQGACRGLSQLWAAAERAREAAEAGDLLAKAAHATVRAAFTGAAVVEMGCLASWSMAVMLEAGIWRGAGDGDGVTIDAVMAMAGTAMAAAVDQAAQVGDDGDGDDEASAALSGLEILSESLTSAILTAPELRRVAVNAPGLREAVVRGARKGLVPVQLLAETLGLENG